MNFRLLQNAGNFLIIYDTIAKLSKRTPSNGVEFCVLDQDFNLNISYWED